MNPPTPQTFVQDAELIDLSELLRALNRYKWSIAAIIFLGGLIAALAAFATESVYRGTATLLIESKREKVVPVAEVYDPGVGRTEYYATQFEILRSQQVAERVVDKLDLVHNDEFADKPPPAWMPNLDWRNWLPFLPQPPASPKSQEEIDAHQREQVIKQFVDMVTVEPVRGTQLLHLSFDAHTPELAAQVSNALADAYIENALQSRLDVTRKANQWLTEKLGDIRGQLEKAERSLQDFRDQEQLVNVGGERNINEEQLLDANKRLRDAQRRKTELASAYSKIQEAGTDASRLQEIGLLLSDSRVTRASENFLSAQETVKQMLQRYGEKHPSMASAQARLDGARNAYNEQLRIAAQGVKAEYEIAETTERSLNGVVGGARAQIKNLDKKQYALGVLEREVSTNKELYNMFLTRFKQTDTVNNYEDLPARVIDEAKVPRARYSPSLTRYGLVGLAVGLIAGLLLTLLRHFMSEEIRSAEELEALSQAPVLGVLPLVPKADRKELATIFLGKPKSTFVEGIRSVRTAIQLSDVDKKFKRVLVTSSIPQEGKSVFAGSLALSFAAMEQTLLIDADLRKPTVASSFGLPPRAPGMTELLAGQAKLEECLYLHQASGLFILPAGKTVPNPAEVLASNMFKGLMDDLSKRFNRIIVDSPPCQAAADALLLSSEVDRVIFLVKAEGTSRRTIKSSLKLLRNVGAPLLGCLVDQVDARKNTNFPNAYYYAAGYYG